MTYYLKRWCESRGIDLRLYIAWFQMKQRCDNPRCRQWDDYGGRGIKRCRRWDSFAAFAADMGPHHPGKGWTLDRKDNDKGYNPRNCRWATRKTQNRNQRRVTLTMKDAAVIRRRHVRGTGRMNPGNTATLAKEYNVSCHTVRNIVALRAWA